MSDINDLQDVVVTLEYHEEDQQAEAVREYVASKRGWTNKLFAGLKKFLFWFLLFGTITGVVYGFIRTMLDGSFFAAFGILIFGTIVFGLVTLIQQGTEAIYDWYKSEMPEERVA